MTCKNKLAVAYAADDNYAKYLGVSMLSLFQNNEEFQTISVFVLDSGISTKNQRKLEGVATRFGRELTFLPVWGIINRLPLKMRSRKIAAAAYARLFLGSLLCISHSKRRVTPQRCPSYDATIVCSKIWMIIPFTLKNVHTLSL